MALAVSDLHEQNTHDGKNYTPALILLAVLYFMMGFITCLNDTLVPYFKKGFTLTYAESSLVQFYFFLTYLMMSVPAGKFVERVGYKYSMVIGFLLAGTGAFLFYPASLFHEYYFFLGALFVLAIGIVLLQVAANPYITLLGPAKTAPSRLTLLQGVGSIGTTVAPFFGAQFILSNITVSDKDSSTLSSTYLGIGAVLLIIAVILVTISLPKIQKTIRTTPVLLKETLSFKNLKLGMLGIFMYVGAEVSIGTFLTNYIVDTVHIQEHDANKYVALYWGGMLVGRLAGALILKYINAQKVLVILSIAAITLITLSLLSDGYAAVWLMVAVGICNSVMFAIIFSSAIAGLGKHTTQASGLLSSAIVGGAVIPYFQGILIDQFNWTISFILPLLCYIYIICFPRLIKKTEIQTT
ncbi:sugar MFS transporter [Gynurincola endophyticus]|uniref:sugar MFS transporter n=1 Tax=Gynurincola endophyticus TaxID=2479004 RepID=UPI000F8F25B4|nr:sugar MFS transporter [Gynurincola endophyticus]